MDVHDDLKALTLSDPYVGLMSLPGELRNVIYFLLLFPYLRTIQIFGNMSDSQLSRSLFRSSVFRINRQIRFEAINFLCSTKKIHIHGAMAASQFFCAINSFGRESLTNIVLQVDAGYPSSSFYQDECVRLLSSASALERMHLAIDVSALSRVAGVSTNFISFLINVKKTCEGMEGVRFSWCVFGTLLSASALKDVKAGLGVGNRLGEGNVLKCVH